MGGKTGACFGCFSDEETMKFDSGFGGVWMVISGSGTVVESDIQARLNYEALITAYGVVIHMIIYN